MSSGSNERRPLFRRESENVGSGSERRALIRRESESIACLRQVRPLRVVLEESAAKALGGGLAGAAAMTVQVGALMWMRTTVTFQYRYGGSTREAFAALYKQGGIRRFYFGVVPALLQAPLSRFGDTAANVGAMSLLNSFESTAALPTGIKTLASASAATLWRVCLMPIDTLKNMLQVEGSLGLSKLQAKLRTGGVPVLFHGAGGLVVSAFFGHYFWYSTYNIVDASAPDPRSSQLQTFARNATVGFIASSVSDTAVNSLRVLKTFRQTSETPISYTASARAIVASDGLHGLFGRGLVTRLLSNGVQAALFSAIWKYLLAKQEERRASMSKPRGC